MLLSLLLVAGQAAPAPSAPAASTPPTVFFTAAQAYGDCLKQGIAAVSPSVTPEVAAPQVIAGCTAQRTTLDAQFDTWIAGTGMPDAARDAARAQYTARMNGVTAHVTENIRAARTATKPAPPPGQ